MAGNDNTIPPPVVDPTPVPVTVVHPPTVTNYDLDLLFPPIVNTALPSPAALDRVAPTRIGRQLVMRTAKPGDPLPYAFGRTVIRPTVIGADDSGEHLVIDFMWGVGPFQRVCNGIVPSSNPPGTWDHSVQFPDLGLKLISGSQFEHFTGTLDQPASSIMTALKGSYPSYPGIAHSIITMQEGWNLNMVGTCDAVMVIDPRVSFSFLTWTQNPALILADMLVRCGYSMDWDSVVDAADYCDEMVGDTGSEIERWKIAGVIHDRADLRSWVQAMSQYAHCFVDRVGNTIYLRPDKPRAHNHVVTKDDIVATIDNEGRVNSTARMKLRGEQNTVEGVRVNFDFHLRTLDAEFGTFDNPGKISQLRMPYWTASFPYLGSHAKRHAEEVYNKSQLEVEEFEFVTFDKGLERTVGDVGLVTYEPYDLDEQEMVVIAVTQEARGRWRLRYTQHSNDSYPETNYTDLDFPETELFNPYDPVPGPQPALDWEFNDDTTPQPYLTLSWTGVIWAYVKDYDVRVYAVGTPEETIYNSADDGYVPHESGFMTLDLSERFVEFGRTYQVDIYVRSIVNALSSEPGTDTTIVDILWDDVPLLASRFTTSSLNAQVTLDFRIGSIVTDDGLPFSACRYEPGFASATGMPVWRAYAPTVDGDTPAGKYVIKWDMVTLVSGGGDVLINDTSGQGGVWFDLLGQTIRISDTAADATVEHVIIDVTIAVDDGAGAPIAGTEHTKQCTLIAYKGAHDYVVRDRFSGASVVLTSHTPDEDDVGGGWVAHTGTFNTDGFHAVSTGNARAVIDAGLADVCIMADLEFASQDAGLIGRAQDADNYWELLVDNADQVDPVLKLNEVVSGTPTTRASVTLTGIGPMDSLSDQLLRLMFDGDDIYGSWGRADATPFFEVTYNSSSFNTETLHGIHSTHADIEWDTFMITTAEIGLLT